MDTVTWVMTRVVPITVLLLAIIAGTGVDGIRCNFCQKLANNEDCNANIAECTNTKHDACYTSVTFTDTNIKYYTKGCHSYKECQKLETKERAKCDKPGFIQNCTYCCRDGSTCNAFNSASRWQHRLPVTSWLLPVCLMSIRQLFHVISKAGWYR